METKVIYIYDLATHEFTGSDVVEDDHELTTGETIVEPAEGLYQPATFDGTNWVGADKEAYEAELEKERQEYLAEHPELSKPTTTETALAQLTLKIATDKIAQDKLNAQLLLASATAQTESGDK